jgi:methylated-DNA-[protein]-cysteine S-methyltransferase
MDEKKKGGKGALEFICGRCACRLEWSAGGLRRFRFRPAGKHGGRRGPAGEGSLRPAFVARAVAYLRRYFAGEKVDFQSVPLDLEGIPEFSRKVYLAARRIPYGETMSYGRLARKAGRARAGRAVGTCMKRNPLPVFIPCHRVVREDGSVGGFSMPGGKAMKAMLLRMEGAI